MSPFPNNSSVPLPLRDFPHCGLRVSPLGLGTVKFGRNTGVKYPNAFDLPDLSALKNLLAYAKSLGVNLLDTAPAYGQSEKRVGELLKGQRQDWVIVGKAGEQFQNGCSHFDFSRKAIVSSVEESLRDLKTDYLDLLLIHSDGQDLEIFKDHEISITLEDLKKSGKIRLGGMSTKTVEGGIMAAEYLDAIMCCYRPGYLTEKPVIDKAQLFNKIVFLKKVLDSGHQVHSIEETMNFVFQHKGVSSVIVGTLNPEHLYHNVESVRQALDVLNTL